ncbi:MAG: hypothetical protein DDT33_01296 [Firmicutes bacterium]|nr:hypothetical protein [Bacillota bacterium]
MAEAVLRAKTKTKTKTKSKQLEQSIQVEDVKFVEPTEFVEDAESTEFVEGTGFMYPVDTQELPLVEQEQEDIEVFVERLMGGGLDGPAGGGVNIPLAEVFQQATNFVSYMSAVQNKSIVLGSRYVPLAITAIGEKAGIGDLEAAKILFDYLGLRTEVPAAQVNTAVHVNIPTLKDVIEIDEDGRIVGKRSFSRLGTT